MRCDSCETGDKRCETADVRQGTGDVRKETARRWFRLVSAMIKI